MRLSLWLLAGLIAGCGSPSTQEANNQADPAAPAPPPSAEGSPSAAIPAAFRGVFDRDREACAARSVYRLIVSADSLRFHESLGRVRSVAVDGPNAISVAADYEGEGDSWSATQRLSLSGDGDRLTIVGRGTETIRVRCKESRSGPDASGWESAASGEGAGLFLEGAGGRRELTLFCPAGSGDLLVNVPAFRPVGSEERMSFGSGGTVVALVADPSGDSGRGGVSGRGPVPAELERILAGKDGLSINYGAQNSGPHPAPPAALATAFLAGCRG
jgi:hypothetical protein